MDSAIGANNSHFSNESTRPNEKSSPSGEYFLLRGGAGPVYSLMKGTLKLEDLTHGARCNTFDAMVATAEPGVSCWEGKVSGGGKWYHILEGALEVIVNDVSHILAQGDSLYLESTAPHIWRNPGNGTARALVLSSPPAAVPGRASVVA